MERFEIHSHSDYSNIRLLDSINKTKDLIQISNNIGLSGICLTDHEALCGHVEFFQNWQSLKESKKIREDFKIGLGNEIYLVGSRNKNEIKKYFHFILLAKNNEGFEALKELSSIAWYNSFFDRGMQRVPTLYSDLKEIISRHPGTLIGSTACLGSEFSYFVLNLIEAEKNKNQENITYYKIEIMQLVEFFKDLFENDFYIEIAPSHTKEQIMYNKRAIEIADALNIKIVIGTDAHYQDRDKRLVHKVYLNSKNGEREVDDFYASAYLMGEEELKSFFPYLPIEKINSIFQNSIEIMNKIEGYSLYKEQVIPLEDIILDNSIVEYCGLQSYPNIITMITDANLQNRYWMETCLNKLLEKNKYTEKYLERLEIEADIINFISEKIKQPLTAYFNTLQHYIELFWECGSIVGPGRGSGVGFLSNYLLDITQIDPIEYDLPHWRFLNKERVEMPDIDIDLAPSKRSLIFKKIRESKVNKIIFDRESFKSLSKVAEGVGGLLQIATFGTEQTRSAILSSCRGYRSLEYPNGIDIDTAQYLTGLIPQERGFLWSLKDVVYGNEEEDRQPIKNFISEVSKYPDLLDIMTSIEGLINKRSQHASGVVIYNTDPWITNAVMRSPSGDLITQFALHESEYLGDIKYDFLATEVCDKIINCLNLLQKDNFFSQDLSIKEIYNQILHPEKINLSDKRIWDALAEGSVLDVFQFNSDVGLQAAKMIKPVNPIEMTSANALMRLMSGRGNERPIERYTRFKFNIEEWYAEVSRYHLTEEEIKIIEKYYLPRYGTPCLQEDLMLVVMDKDISGFTLKESNEARKIVAKKQMSRIPELKDKFFKQCESINLASYIWDTVLYPQLGYAFSILHSLAYSFVGIQTLLLATNFPNIYWNCACLITNSGGAQEEKGEDELKEEDEDEEEDEEEKEDEEELISIKKRIKNTDYGKISTAIGTMQKAGINISPPDINRSQYTFIPDKDNNTILYGMKGINQIGEDLVNAIIQNRPYISLKDFTSKVKMNKPQVINLIKSGSFDKFGASRKEILYQYIESISDKKEVLNLRNVQMLIEHSLLTGDNEYYARLFNFNKYIKRMPKLSYYLLDDIAYKFYSEFYDIDAIEYLDGLAAIKGSDWDKFYKKDMINLKKYIQDNQAFLLKELNNQLTQEVWNKYCQGTISKWEMDSMGFYYHGHELKNLKEEDYDIVNFFSLNPNSKIDRIVPMNGRSVPLYTLYRIAGTVLDKDKNKSTVTLLTNYGVVVVKIYQAQFSKYNKQISIKLADGRKKIVEKSWFTRGNKLIVTGIRRDDTFVPKVYKNSPYKHSISLITSINKDGTISLQNIRSGDEE